MVRLERGELSRDISPDIRANVRIYMYFSIFA